MYLPAYGSSILYFLAFDFILFFVVFASIIEEKKFGMDLTFFLFYFGPLDDYELMAIQILKKYKFDGEVGSIYWSVSLTTLIKTRIA